MRVCVITAVMMGDAQTAYGKIWSECVIATTLAECKRKAKKKWKWYGLDYAERHFYKGTEFGKTTTRWMKLDDEKVGAQLGVTMTAKEVRKVTAA